MHGVETRAPSAFLPSYPAPAQPPVKLNRLINATHRAHQFINSCDAFIYPFVDHSRFRPHIDKVGSRGVLYSPFGALKVVPDINQAMGPR